MTHCAEVSPLTHLLKTFPSQCLSQKCFNILLDLSITNDGHLVVLHRSTLEKANINLPVHGLKLNALENFNITEHHPLGLVDP